MRVLALLLCAPGVGAWWRDLPPRDQGEPPYPYPATHSDGTAVAPHDAGAQTTYAIDKCKQSHISTCLHPDGTCARI